MFILVYLRFKSMKNMKVFRIFFFKWFFKAFGNKLAFVFHDKSSRYTVSKIAVRILKTALELTVNMSFYFLYSIHVTSSFFNGMQWNWKSLSAYGGYREDLFFRMVGLPLELPPLRDRDNDVIILAKHFINEFAKNIGK